MLRSRPRAPTIADLALFLLGVAGMAASITLVFLAMRAVMDVGGYCAEGGAYVIQQHCPDGATPALFLGIFGGFAATGLTAWKGAALGHGFGGVAILGWPALFGTLGFNFLQYGITPGPDVPGPDIGWLICGVVFELMALPVLVGVAMGMRDAVRPKAGRPPSPAPRPSVFRPPPRRITPETPAMQRALADLDRALRTGLAARVAEETFAPGPGGGVAAGTAAAAADDVEVLVDGLERLTALHASGALSDTEFADAKAKLLEAADR